MSDRREDVLGPAHVELPLGRLRERPLLFLHPSHDHVEYTDHLRRWACHCNVICRVSAGVVVHGLLCVDEHHLQHHRHVCDDGSQVELEFRCLFLSCIVLIRASVSCALCIVHRDPGHSLGGAGRVV